MSERAPITDRCVVARPLCSYFDVLKATSSYVPEAEADRTKLGYRRAAARAPAHTHTVLLFSQKRTRQLEARRPLFSR